MKNNLTPRKQLIPYLALVIALLVLPSYAGEGSSEDAIQKPEVVSQEAPPTEHVAPSEMTCSEIKDLLLDEEHQEEASYLTVWAYGLHTGATGMDFEKNPVTKAGLENFVTRVILSCKANPDRLFVDAILEKRP